MVKFFFFYTIDLSQPLEIRSGVPNLAELGEVHNDTIHWSVHVRVLGTSCSYLFTHAGTKKTKKPLSSLLGTGALRWVNEHRRKFILTSRKMCVRT